MTADESMGWSSSFVPGTMAETMRQSDVLAMLVTDSVSQYRQKCFTSVRRPILTLGRKGEKASQGRAHTEEDKRSQSEDEAGVSTTSSTGRGMMARPCGVHECGDERVEERGHQASREDLAAHLTRQQHGERRQHTEWSAVRSRR